MTKIDKHHLTSTKMAKKSVATFKPLICTKVNGLKSSRSLASSMVRVQPHEKITSFISNGWDLSLSKKSRFRGSGCKTYENFGK
jgi:hypothetical protein